MKEYYRQLRRIMLEKKKERILNRIPKLLDDAVQGKIIKVNFMGLDSDFIFWGKKHRYLDGSRLRSLKCGIASYKRLFQYIHQISEINRKLAFM